jgi:aryl-alcohol dehydrogenase-like predicted oxidoreductase
MKLALGTVQFGLPYGVTNTSGQPCESEVRAILNRAAAAGVKILDTACLYGDSEDVLGRCLPAGHDFLIVTKTPKMGGMGRAAAVAALSAAFAQSCARLRVPSVYGLLAHDANDLLGAQGEALWQAMLALRAGGHVSRIGASVYSGAQVDALLQHYPLDLIQLPMSLLDQRMLRDGQLDRLQARGVEIHVRSVFLQGALLMVPDALPPHLAGLRPQLSEIASRANRLGIRPLQAALQFVAALPQVSAMVCGVDSAAQFDELVAALNSTGQALDSADLAACACADAKLLDPSQWSTA